MKTTFRDGTCELVFDPLSFIGRLLALIPPPRFHMLRYAGVLGPGAKLRREVVEAVTAQSQRAAMQLTLVAAGQPVSQVQDDASPATRHPSVARCGCFRTRPRPRRLAARCIERGLGRSRPRR
jgi:hypothetical protein